MNFIIYLVICLGVTYAWSDTKISIPVRNQVAKFYYLSGLLCQECSSFWISLLVSFFLNPLKNEVSFGLSNILCAFCGFFINLYFVRKKIIPYEYEL